MLLDKRITSYWMHYMCHKTLSKNTSCILGSCYRSAFLIWDWLKWLHFKELVRIYWWNSETTEIKIAMMVGYIRSVHLDIGGLPRLPSIVRLCLFVCKYLFSINNNSLGLYLSLTAFVNKICLMTLSDFFEYSCSKQWKIPFLWGKHLEMDIKCENLDRYTYVLHQLQWSLLLIGFKKIDLEWIIEMVIPNISSRVPNSI